MNCHRYTSTKQARLRFFRSVLLDDIRHLAYVEGDVMQRDNNHDKHQVFDIAEKGNIERQTRMLDLAFAQCAEALYPYAKKNVSHYTARDNNLDVEDREYSMLLTLPPTFSESTVTILEHLIHEYLVSSVLADWFSITKPESAPTWSNKAASYKDEIMRARNHRTNGIRRKMCMFEEGGLR